MSSCPDNLAGFLWLDSLPGFVALQKIQAKHLSKQLLAKFWQQKHWPSADAACKASEFAAFCAVQGAQALAFGQAELQLYAARHWKLAGVQLFQ